MRMRLLIVGIILMMSTVVIVLFLPTSDSDATHHVVQSANGLYLYPFATETTPYYIRAKNQTPYGLYDAISNTTYLAYPAGIVEKNGSEISKTSAYVTSFNHTNHDWHEPVEVTPQQPTTDSHNVPQIIMDHEGYLHVFHVAHADASGIVQAVSQSPRSIDAWELTAIPGTAGGGYLAAYTANNDIYLFYRARLDDVSQCTGDQKMPKLCVRVVMNRSTT